MTYWVIKSVSKLGETAYLTEPLYDSEPWGWTDEKSFRKQFTNEHDAKLYLEYVQAVETKICGDAWRSTVVKVSSR